MSAADRSRRSGKGFTPGQRANYRVCAAAHSNDWGYKVACEKFGAEVVGRFPVHTRGAAAGRPKGYLLFIKATRGGWAYNVPGYPQGRIVYPGSSDWKLAMHIQEIDPHGHSVVATWHRGRDGTADSIQVLQTPEEAEALFKTYGKDPRFG